jgi:phosphomannomutase/phosphoglucomutase
MASGEFATGAGVVCDHDIVPAYLDDLAARLCPARPVKVVLDGGNGAGGLICAELLRRLGAEVVELYTEPDGDFPNHHPDPLIEANLADLKAAVLREGAELGLALDGDADRIGVVDEKGRMVYGDEVLAIFARDVLAGSPGATILADVKCTQRLFREIESLGGHPLMSVTGHSVVKARMIETGARLGGELSGHMFFADRYYGFDDAIYAAARTVEIVSKRPGPVSGFLAHWPVAHSTPEIHVPCPEAHKFEVVGRAVDHFSALYDTITVDGVRVVFPDGWGLVRASNTQPLLVLRFEAESEARLAEIRALVEEPVRRWIAEAGA